MTLATRALSALTLTATLLLASGGCRPDDVGLPCTIKTASTDASVASTVIDKQALDCRSRLCVRFGGTPNANKIGPLCTEVCESDSDCPDQSVKCKHGFRCVVGSVVGGLRCCKVCVCKDLIPANFDEDPAACRGVEPVCPKL